jgi:WD40 repeat protein
VVEPSRGYVYSGHVDGQVRSWKLKATELLSSRYASAVGVTAIDCRELGGDTLILAGGRDGEVRLIRGPADPRNSYAEVQVIGRRSTWTHQRFFIRTADPICLHEGEIKEAKWLDGGRRFVTCGADQFVRVWEVLSERRPRATLTAPPKRSRNIAFSADGRVLVSDKGLWQGISGSRMGIEFPFEMSHRVRSGMYEEGEAGINRDGTLALIQRPNATALEIWNVASRKVIARLDGPGPLTSFVYNAHDNAVLAGYNTKGLRAREPSPYQVWLWNLDTKKSIGTPLSIDSSIHRLAVSPDGQWLVVSGGYRVRVWSNKDHLESWAALELPFEPHAVAFLPDGKTLAIVENKTFKGCEMWLWDVREKKLVGQPIALSVQSGDFLKNLAFTPDGKAVVVCFGSTVCFCDAATGRLIGPPLGSDAFSHSDWIALHPDGKTLAILYGNDPPVEFWDMPTPIGGTVEQIRLWCQVSANAELDRTLTVRPLDAAKWEERSHALERIGRPSNLPSTEPVLEKPGEEKPKAEVRQSISGTGENPR